MTATSRPLTPVNAGFIPLTDCAVLAVAAERGFAREEGIDLRLHREVSWANIRDKVDIGHFDCAHMLAGMPIAASLGIGHITVPMLAPFALGINGNGITLSRALFESLGIDEAAGPMASAVALKAVIGRRAATGAPPLTFAMVFPFSTHNYQLRYWMASAGIDPDRDVRLVVIPPPFMADSLEAGQIDGFCVGEPWNTLAVERGTGVLVVPGVEVCAFCPEKVLGVTVAWADRHPETLAALLRALDAAAAWADRPENHADLANLLAAERYLDLPADLIGRAVRGHLPRRKGGDPHRSDDFLIFHGRSANRPRPDHALWLYSQMVRWGQVEASPGAEATARAVYRPDLYDASRDTACGGPPEPMRLFDGRPFDMSDIPGYAGMPATRPAND